MRSQTAGTSLLQPVEGLLQQLPVLLPDDLFARGVDDFRLVRVFVGAVDFVKNAELSGECFLGELVGGVFVGHIVIGGNEVEGAALARVGGVKRAFVKFH